MGQLVKEKLLSFLKFPVGWHFGEGGIFSQERVDEIFGFWHKYVEGKYKSDVFPGIGGEILLSVYHKNGHYYQFLFEEDGSYTAIHEDEKEEMISEEINLKFKDIVNIVKNLGD